MDDFIKKNYKNPEEIIRLYYSELAKLKGNFSRKYPSADMTKFDFQVSIDRDGNLESSKIYFNVDSISAFDIESNDFNSNPKYTKYLYNNKKETWPKIWSDNGSRKPKFTRLRYPKDYLTDCDDHKCGIPAD